MVLKKLQFTSWSFKEEKNIFLIKNNHFSRSFTSANSEILLFSLWQGNKNFKNFKI